MNTRLKRRGNASKTAAVALTLLLLIVNMASVFALGPSGPTFFINVNQLTQKITAGEPATYNVDLTAWAGQFNVTVGLAERRRADWQQLSPLPTGVEAVYPKQIYIKTGSEDYRFPVVVKTSPDMKESTVDIEILVVGRYVDEPIGVVANIRLYVVPRITSLGAASTVFYEGFDKWNEREGSWIVNSKGGSVEMYDLNDPGIDYPGTPDLGWSMYHPYASLRLTKNFLDYAVGAEHPIPSLNGSFVLEFAMRPDEKRINFTFDLTDTLQNTGIYTEFLDGNLAVQGRSYGTYSTAQWYKFRFENNATGRTIQWYLNGKYMDSLPFTGAPDRIKTEISGSGVGTGYIDDIFLQKVEGGPPTLTTVISNNTASTPSWIPGWNYRKSHTINSASDAGNNYQVEITVHRANGLDYGKDVYLNYRSLNWPNDIRFTGKDGVTELYYWLEDFSTDTATFWVKVNDDISYSSATIYIYYGKSDASSISNGGNTFEFFDDFSASSLDASKWLQTRGSSSVSNSLLTLSGGARIDSKINFGLHYAAYFRSQYTSWDFNGGQLSTGFGGELNNDNNSLYIYAFSEPNFFTFVTRKDGSHYWVTMIEPEDSNWHNFKYFRASSSLAQAQLDNGSINYLTTDIPTIPLPVTVETRQDYTGTIKTDLVFVKKYVFPEPSQGRWSNEQSTNSQTPERSTTPLSEWNYRKSHVINNALDAGTNYQIRIVVNKGGGIDQGDNVYLSNHVLNWPNDIRFTASDGITELDYWLENISTSTATFWVKVKDNLSSASTTIYIYYGRSDASSASNGNNTFDFFDDFDGSALDASKWSAPHYPNAGTSISVHDGLLDFNVSSAYNWTGGTVLSKNTLLTGNNYAITTKVKMTNLYASALGAYAGFTNAPVYNDIYGNPPNLVSAALWDDIHYNQYLILHADTIPAVQGTTPIEVRNLWFRMTTIYTPTTYAKGIWEQLESPYAEQTLQVSGTGGISPNYIAIGIGDYNTNEHTYFDYVFVRKHISPEPSQGSWGREEPADARTNYPSGWLPEFDYRKSHVINPASGAGVDYQIKVTVHKGSGTDADADIYLNNNALNWPNDIRFTGSNGLTELDYWLESSDSNVAVFWVKIRDNLSDRSATIYIYYGEPNALSTSSGGNTFAFFDDFNGSSLDTTKWSAALDSSYTVSNSVLQITQGAIGLQNALGFNINDGYLVESRIRYDRVDSGKYSGTLETSSSQFTADSNYNSDATILYMVDAPSGSTAVHNWVASGSSYGYDVAQGANVFTMTPGTWYILGDGATRYTASVWTDYSRINSYDITWSQNMQYVALGAWYRNGAYDLKDTSYDWIRIRKYVSPEPSQGSWGDEQPANSTTPTPPASSGLDWGYRKSHTINAAANAGSNYQIRIVAHRGEGTDSGENVYLNGKSRSWPNDIRFTGKDGETQLNYWLESFDDNTAIFWVKIRDDISSAGTTLYIYYGRSGAPSASDGSSTFAFFDDFSGGDIDRSKWTVVGEGTWSIDSGSVKGVHITPPTYGDYLEGIYSPTVNQLLHAKVKVSPVNTNAFVYYRFQDISNIITGYLQIPDLFYMSGRSSLYWNEGPTSCNWSHDTWYTVEVMETSANSFTATMNGACTTTNTVDPVSGNLGLFPGGGAGSTAWYDDVYVRKHVTPEPSQGGWSNEQPADSQLLPELPAEPLSEWSYRKSHIINPASGAGANYQVKIVIHRGTGYDSAENVYLNGKSRSWPNDIRFTGSDGVTELNYWLESYDDSAAVFWVKLNDDLSSRSAVTYLYYGKSNAVSASNGDATFIFFDDFSGESLNPAKWQIYAAGNGGSVDVSNGILRMRSYGGDLDWVAIRTASIFSAPYAWAARLNFTDYTTQMAGLYRESDINPSEYGAAKFATPYGSKVSQESDYVSYQQRQQTFNFNQFYDFEIRRDASGYNDFYINDSIVQDDRIYTYSGPTRLMLGSYYLAAGTFEADWVLIRKYASAEPNQGGWGREEPANARKSYPSVWLSGFDYRKLHAINSAAGAGADYQIKLIIHKGSGTDSGADVYLNNHALSWPYDIRFTGSDGVTDLSYWLESADSNTAVFWVKIRDDLSARDATLYVYYDRPNALSASNGGDTFEFFDDFSGSTLDASKWSVQSASTSLSNSILTVTNPSTTFSGIRRIDRIDLSNLKAVEAKVKWDSVSETNHFSFGLFDTAGPTIWWNGYSTHYYAYPDNPYKNVYVYVCDGDCDARATIIGGYDNSWHRLSINAKVGYEPTLWWDGLPYHIDRNLAGTTFYLWPAKAYDELNKQIQIDWVFIRKLTPTEPSHGSWGSEENLSGQLVITTSVTLTRTVIETSTVTSTQISTSTITQSTIVTNTFAAKSAEQATEPLSSVWAIGATIIALALTEVLLLKRTR